MTRRKPRLMLQRGIKERSTVSGITPSLLQQKLKFETQQASNFGRLLLRIYCTTLFVCMHVLVQITRIYIPLMHKFKLIKVPKRNWVTKHGKQQACCVECVTKIILTKNLKSFQKIKYNFILIFIAIENIATFAIHYYNKLKSL